MKNYKKKLLIFLATITSVGAIAQTDEVKSRPLYGPYGADVRIRASFGLLPDAQFKAFPKLQTLKGKRVGLLLLMPDEIGLSLKPFFPKEKVSADLGFKISQFSDSLISADLITSRRLEAEVVKVDTIGIKSLLRTRTFGQALHIPLKDNSNALKAFREKNNIDLLLVVAGGGFEDFIKTSRINFEAQGLFKQGGTYVYAGHRICLIDLNTGKQVPKGFCIQASADYSSVEFKKTFSDYSPEELSVLENEIKIRIKNNFVETVKILFK